MGNMFLITDLQESGISIVLGSFNRLKFLKLTIKSIRDELELSGIPYEIIVVDGGSNDGTIKWLSKQKDIITIIQHNRGEWKNKPIPRRSWGYFINLGFRSAHGKYVCMLSDDCLVIPNALINGYNFFNNELAKGTKCGAVPFFWRDWPIKEEYALNLCYGIINLNHGMYLRSALEKVGFADEETYQFYRGDVDIIFKLINIGYTISPAYNSYIDHYSHANVSNRASNLIISKKDNENFIKKWKEMGTNILSLDWNRGDEVINQIYHDPAKTVKLYYPYCTTYRLGKVFMEIWREIRDTFGESRLNKLGLERIKKELDKTDNLHLKKFEYLVYNIK